MFIMLPTFKDFFKQMRMLFPSGHDDNIRAVTSNICKLARMQFDWDDITKEIFLYLSDWIQEEVVDGKARTLYSILRSIESYCIARVVQERFSNRFESIEFKLTRQVLEDINFGGHVCTIQHKWVMVLDRDSDKTVQRKKDLVKEIVLACHTTDCIDTLKAVLDVLFQKSRLQLCACCTAPTAMKCKKRGVRICSQLCMQRHFKGRCLCTTDMDLRFDDMDYFVPLQPRLPISALCQEMM